MFSHNYLFYKQKTRTWRRERDSNPRYRIKPVCFLSREVPSTTRPSLRQEGDSIQIYPKKVKPLGGIFQLKRLVQYSYGKLYVFLFDNHGDFYFASGNHLDVDAFLSQRAEHLAGDTDM